MNKMVCLKQRDNIKRKIGKREINSFLFFFNALRKIVKEIKTHFLLFTKPYSHVNTLFKYTVLIASFTIGGQLLQAAVTGSGPTSGCIGCDCKYDRGQNEVKNDKYYSRYNSNAVIIQELNDARTYTQKCISGISKAGDSHQKDYYYFRVDADGNVTIESHTLNDHVYHFQVKRRAEALRYIYRNRVAKNHKTEFTVHQGDWVIIYHKISGRAQAQYETYITFEPTAHHDLCDPRYDKGVYESLNSTFPGVLLNELNDSKRSQQICLGGFSTDSTVNEKDYYYFYAGADMDIEVNTTSPLHHKFHLQIKKRTPNGLEVVYKNNFDVYEHHAKFHANKGDKIIIFVKEHGENTDFYNVIVSISPKPEEIINSADDLCYKEPEATGGFMCQLSNDISGGFCTGGIGCGIKFPLANIGDANLTDVIVDYNETDMGGSFGSHCKTNPEGTCQTKENIDMGPFGFMGSATEFHFTNPIEPYTDKGESVEFSAFMSMKCIKNENLYGTYVKNGKRYRGKIKKCADQAPGEEEIPNENVTPISPTCRVFEDMFQTREACNSGGGWIDIQNAGNTLDHSKNIIVNNPDNKLTTCTFKTKRWILDQFNTCGIWGDCIAQHTSAKSLDINYTDPPAIANLQERVALATNDVKITQDITLRGTAFDEIKPKNGGISNFTVNFEITDFLKINEIDTTKNNTYNFSSSLPYDLQIGNFKVDNNGEGTTVKTLNRAKNIKIYRFEQHSNANVELNASRTIKMDKFYVGHGSTVKLKAPYVNINHFEPTNYGNGNTEIDIYADYIDMDYIELAQRVTVRIHPYTPGKKILFRNNRITESSSSTILLSSGKYYVNHDFVIPGTSGVSAIRALNEDQEIDFILNHGLEVGNNPGINALGKNGNFGTLKPVKFRLYINGNLKTGGGGTTINATVYVEGNVKLGNPTYIRGAVNAYHKIEVGQGQFIYDQNITEAGWGICATPNPQYTSGPFDAWDTFRSISDRNISTKIVNQPFDLIIASINKDNNDTETKPNITIKYTLFDADSNRMIEPNWHDYNASKDDKIQHNFTVSQAHKNVTVVFALCADYNASSKKYLLYPYDKCHTSCPGDRYYDGPMEPCWRHFTSSDEFAVRPDKFDSNMTTNGLIAERNVSLLFTALDAKGNPTIDFNESQNSSFIVELNLSDPSLNCIQTKNEMKPKINFSDGNVTGNYRFKYIGDYNLTIREKSECDQKFAAVDCDDATVQDSNGHLIWSVDKNLSITPFVLNNISIKPARFIISNVKYIDADSEKGYTYLSNLNDDRRMFATLQFDLSAGKENNETAENYVNGCYAKDFNISFNFSKSKNNNLALQMFDDLDNTISEGKSREFSASYFVKSKGGKAAIKLSINFDRNASKPIEKFEHNITNIEVKDKEDLHGNSSPHVGGVHYYYARLHAPNYQTYTNSIETPIYVEVYNTTNPGNDWNESVDDVNWWIHPDHAVADGNITNLTPKIGFSDQTDSTVQTDVNNTLSNGVFPNSKITYKGTQKPHKTQIRIGTQPWLKYHRFISDPNTMLYYDVDFLGGGGWAGVGEKGKTLPDVNGTSERIEW